MTKKKLRDEQPGRTYGETPIAKAPRPKEERGETPLPVDNKPKKD